MEKIIYLLWRDPRTEAVDFGRRLRAELVPRLLELGAHNLQLNIADSDAHGAAPVIQSTRPQMEAFVSLWLPTANLDRRQPVDDAVTQAAGHFAAYLVTESQPILNTRFPAQTGVRTEGFAQMALFQRPPRLNRQAWLDIWLGSHTQIAIDTQDTFFYVQNLVSRALTFDAPPYDAIVEEGFPPAASGNVHAFYDAAGDEGKFRSNKFAMMESCSRFIDFNRLDVMPTSQYLIKPLG